MEESRVPQYVNHMKVKARAQFHKGLLNIEGSMLLKLDLTGALAATIKVFH